MKISKRRKINLEKEEVAPFYREPEGRIVLPRQQDNYSHERKLLCIYLIPKKPVVALGRHSYKNWSWSAISQISSRFRIWMKSSKEAGPWEGETMGGRDLGFYWLVSLVFICAVFSLLCEKWILIRELCLNLFFLHELNRSKASPSKYPNQNPLCRSAHLFSADHHLVASHLRYLLNEPFNL